MKNVIANIQNTKGFVSIESILVIGAVVILAGLILFFFNGEATDTTDNAGAQVDKAQAGIQKPATGELGGSDLTFTP